MNARREFLLALILFALLAPAILCAHAWSLVPSTAWLLGALAALALGIVFVVLGAGLWPRRWQRQAWTLAGALALALFQGARLVSYYFQGEGFNERFFFHLSADSLQAAGAYWPLATAVAALLLAVALVALLLVPPARPAPRRALLGGLAIAACLLLDPALRQTFSAERVAAMAPADIPWQALGLDAAALNPVQADVAEGGRNLVLIYLEGLERVYTEASVFPGLTPNLERFADEGLRFTGFVSTEGTTWTVGGLLASQCGTPLLHDFGAGGNDILQNGFLSRALCLGDVLSAAGYRQVFMGGASTRFAGKGAFLAAHGYDEVLGREELVPRLNDAAYQNGWGLFDDSLFALAAEQFDALAAGDAPFNLTLLTLDTHHPQGHASASCPPYAAIDNSLLHAVHCTDFLLGRFLDTLRSHPAWRDTVVVLMSDHLAMRNVAQHLYPPDYQRRPLLLVLNTGAGEVARQASHMDVAPTVLDLLEVRGETRFLAGRSLMSGTAPAAALTDLEAPERLRALRYANTFLLSGQGASLCQAGSPMLDFTAGSLHLGGREAVLSVSGERLAPDVLASSHALVGVLAADGSIASLTTAGLATLPHLLYTLRDETLLLVGPGAGLPSLVQRERTGEGILVLLGNPRGAFVELDAARSVNELFVEPEGCAGLLEAARVPGDASDAKVLAEVCEAGAAGYLENEVLRLPRVWIENGWYEAVLDGNAEDGFVLRERRALEDQADAAGCAAWFGNGRLLVPRVEGASGIGALTLRMVPGTVGEFENVRVFPR